MAVWFHPDTKLRRVPSGGLEQQAVLV